MARNWGWLRSITCCSTRLMMLPPVPLALGQDLPNKRLFPFRSSLPVETGTHAIHNAGEVLEEVFPVVFGQVRHLNGSSSLTEQDFQIVKTKTSEIGRASCRERV